MKTVYLKMREHTLGSDAGAGTLRDVSRACIQETRRMQEGMDIGPAACVHRRCNKTDQNPMKNSAVLREIKEGARQAMFTENEWYWAKFSWQIKSISG